MVWLDPDPLITNTTYLQGKQHARRHYPAVPVMGAAALSHCVLHTIHLYSCWAVGRDTTDVDYVRYGVSILTLTTLNACSPDQPLSPQGYSCTIW